MILRKQQLDNDNNDNNVLTAAVIDLRRLHNEM